MGEATITCGNCGTVNAPRANYCQECGAVLAAYASPAGSQPTSVSDVPLVDASAPAAPEPGTTAPPVPGPEPVAPNRPQDAAPSDGDADAVAAPLSAGSTLPVPPPDLPAADSPPATPTLSGTLGSGAVGPINVEPPWAASSAAEPEPGAPAAPAEAAPGTAAAPEAGVGRIGRLDARVAGRDLGDAGGGTGAASAHRTNAPSRIDEAWPIPEPDREDAGPASGVAGTRTAAGSATGARLASTPPQTILTVGAVLVLASCVIGIADLPGYLELLLFCGGPIGFVLLIVGVVMRISQSRQPTRRF